MIVPMSKVFVACRSRERQRLLDALGELGVLHIKPVNPARAVPDESAVVEVKEVERAVQVLSRVRPVGNAPNVSAEAASREVLAIQRRASERQNRLAALDNQLRQTAMWGDVELRQFELLRAAGLDVQFFSVPPQDAAAVRAECVQELGVLADKRVLMAVIDPTGTASFPLSAESIPLPPRDAPSIRAEAAELDAAGKEDSNRLAQLAHLAGKIGRAVRRKQGEMRYAVALRSAAEDDHLFAIQGWVPKDEADSLKDRLTRAGIDAATQVLEPAEDETPPTLLRPPAWARPIEGLFKILGTVPGYREFDVSPMFMIALPIFAAMLFADAGYSGLMLVLPLVFYRKLAGVMGKEFTHLLIAIGGVGVAWGLIIGSFFGFTLPYSTPISVDVTEESRHLMMKISFFIGAAHLSLAQLWQAVRLYPSQQFLNKVGWATFLWGIMGVIRMFVLKDPLGWDTPYPYLLIVGAALAILFDNASRNPFKRLLLGVANFPLAMLGTFSDVMSYVRLMAVGLAGSVLAVSFNSLVGNLGFWPLTAVAFAAAHTLNMFLCLIALFAHGVRLNILEFSNNLGMQWTGYAYQPFSGPTTEET